MGLEEPGAGTERPRMGLGAAGMELEEPEMELGVGMGPGEPQEMEVLLSRLRSLDPAEQPGRPAACPPCPLHMAMRRGLRSSPCCARHPDGSRPCHGLLFADTDREALLSLLRGEGGMPEPGTEMPLAHSGVLAGASLEMLRAQEEPAAQGSPQSSEENREPPSSCLAFKDVPGPCDPEDLLDGVIFGAKYLGSTQLVSERNPPTRVRMAQAQEAVDRIKAPEGESQPMTEVDLFVSTQRIKVLTADTQEAMMDHSLQTISYIADIGSLVVLMARRKLPQCSEGVEEKRLYKMICHVFHSTDAQVIAQAIGQAFGVAYQRFLEANSIDPSELSPRQYNCALEDQEQYNAELTHFSRQENCKDVCIRKQKGEILGIAIVESGWGSVLPTVVIANLMHGGPAERSGELSIGDRLMSINRTSLVGLPLATCQSIIRELKHQTEVMLSIVHCPPVTTAVIRRPDSKYQLGFCVENGVDSRTGHSIPDEALQERKEGQNPLPHPAGHAAFDAAQDTVGFWAVSAHSGSCHLLIDQHPKSFSAGLLSITSLPIVY
ncbi:amyloid-beta A4 precursor protein-binding family A member 3 isoform X4 [Cuculus canorus]|uniref:amyloid-beta A4 precursor protein-binding family A member 3 isoform X4 n=1 Tax=Cuculus canorus TaxID=55661 RepID=UPI0023AB3E21|nr:amyloid-beta A4 precursor protein-binding family A member 3 isoform X4 [Cuculus canorus]